MPLIIPISIFFLIVFGVVGIYWLFFNKENPANRRLEEIRKEETQEDTAPPENIFVTVAEKIAEPINRMAPPSAAEAGKLQKKLMHAGYRSPNSVMIYRSIQLVSLVGFPMIAVMALSSMGMSIFGNPSVLLISVFIGYLLPRMVLDSKIKNRQLNIQWGLADALDLLVISVEAGLGLNQAMVRVGQELKASHPHICEEFELVNTEIRLGRERNVALKNLADRTGVDDMRGLCAMMIQADRFGTSIARAIRVYSDSLRTRRRQRAEQAAQKAAIKLLMPLALFLFPTLFIVIIGPAAIQLIDNFFPK